jgi:hypothetical protein
MDFSMIADWRIILFFLWFGLKTLISALDNRASSLIGGIIGLAAALAAFIDLSPSIVTESEAGVSRSAAGF